MPRAPALVALLALPVAWAAVARAQDTPAGEPAEASAEGDAGSAALDLFRGAAALDTVATCRSGSYGDEASTVRSFAVAGELIDPPEDVRALLEGSVPWTKKGRPYSEDACNALRKVIDELLYRGDITEA